MSETKKTALFAGIALALALIAMVFAPDRITPEAFLDQGEPFFPDFADPNEATTLEVIEFDEASSLAHPFKVTFKGNQWTIPSHHDYPADGKDRLAKTAAGVIDIKKDDFRSNNVADHEACGVIDPLDETVLGVGGRGQRITLRGAGDQVLADFIVGKEVPGRQGLRYVRVPGQNRVYAARMKLDISTRFADWIETNLLEVSKNKIDKVILNDYSINERTRSVVKKDSIVLSKQDDTWKLNHLSSDQELDTTKGSRLLSDLEALSIVGVRLKPEGLSASLTRQQDASEISQVDAMSLQNKGFYFARDGSLLSNEGELLIHTADGVIYTLRFGEVLFGSGLAVTAGASESEGGKDDDGTENRYLFITTRFDENYFKKPHAPADTLYRGKADSLWTVTDRENKSRQDKLDAWQRKADRGRLLADNLNTRFAAWYYLISADSFDKVHVNRGNLLKEQES